MKLSAYSFIIVSEVSIELEQLPLLSGDKNLTFVPAFSLQHLAGEQMWLAEDTPQLGVKEVFANSCERTRAYVSVCHVVDQTSTAFDCRTADLKRLSSKL